jgi:O-methyltransferase involved in polyketide biosynthesis
MPRSDDDSWDITESVGATALGVAAARAAASEEDNPLIEDQKFLAIVANPGRMGLRCLVARRTRCLPVSSADTSN